MSSEYFVGILKGKGSLGRPRGRWADNTKLDRKEEGWDGVDWITSVSGHGPVTGPCEHGSELSGSLKICRATVNCSRDVVKRLAHH